MTTARTYDHVIAPIGAVTRAWLRLDDSAAFMIAYTRLQCGRERVVSYPATLAETRAFAKRHRLSMPESSHA